MSYLDRIVSDSLEREEWESSRRFSIGASDAAKFAKVESAELYLRQKLTVSDFAGNQATRSGNRWEPMLLAFAGYKRNTFTFHHPDEKGFTATPDGIREENGVLSLCEIKTKHNQVITGPSLQELRQLCWQLYVFPEAEYVDFCWGELVRKGDDWDLRRDPEVIRFHRDDKPIREVTELVLPIAGEVLAGLNAALEEEVNF